MGLFDGRGLRAEYEATEAELERLREEVRTLNYGLFLAVQAAGVAIRIPMRATLLAMDLSDIRVSVWTDPGTMEIVVAADAAINKGAGI